MSKRIIVIILTSIILACGSENESSQEIDYGEFQLLVQASVSIDALSCGDANIGSRGEFVNVNSCIAEAFNNGEEFYATYLQRGSGGESATAYTRGVSGNVYKWGFFSLRTEIPVPLGSYSKGECINPRLGETLDSSPWDVFLCD